MEPLGFTALLAELHGILHSCNRCHPSLASHCFGFNSNCKKLKATIPKFKKNTHLCKELGKHTLCCIGIISNIEQFFVSTFKRFVSCCMSFQDVLINLMLGCRLAFKCMLYFPRFFRLVTSEGKTASLQPL